MPDNSTVPLKLREIDQYRNDMEINATLKGLSLTFTTTWGLFSPKAIDEGSRLLLDHVDVQETDSVLDIGCGYGPLGITLATLAPLGNTLMLDKDFVAVDYSNRNVALNKLNNCKAILSNGLSNVPKDEQFDVIVSNLPAKVGNEMLYIYLADCLKHLKPGGAFYVVTINGLRSFMKRSFNEVFGNYKKIKQGKNYTISATFKD